MDPDVAFGVVLGGCSTPWSLLDFWEYLGKQAEFVEQLEAWRAWPSMSIFRVIVADTFVADTVI